MSSHTDADHDERDSITWVTRQVSVTTASSPICRVCEEPLRPAGDLQGGTGAVHEACRVELRRGVSLY
ncbi:hypothetical protein [Natronomonas marina]|uniref:hypothetical protein n=1 Tax=Natronomonas marina TaxID=2961939 RepID=UPI0020C96867|nr:hypothetical protein [Natronomonas marina]